MRFKLRQMEVFRAVMLSGSMSEAARLLNITQPAVSRIIAYTEQSLGLRLFERMGNKLFPTAEAQLLIREVEELYDGAKRVDAIARDLARRPGGTLAIAASPSLALNFIPPVIARFLEACPDVHVRYHTALLADFTHQLLSRRASLAISVLPVSDPGILSEPLVDGDMTCVLPVSHPLAASDRLSLRDIAPHRLVMYDSAIPFGRLIGQAFDDLGVTPRIAMEVPRAELAISMVASGIGVAIVDEFAASGNLPAGLTSRPLVEPIRITLSLLQSRYHPADGQTLRIFTGLLKSQVERLRAEPAVKMSGYREA